MGIIDKDNEAVFTIIIDSTEYKNVIDKVTKLTDLAYIKPLSFETKLDFCKDELNALISFLGKLDLFYYDVKVYRENNPPDILFAFSVLIRKFESSEVSRVDYIVRV